MITLDVPQTIGAVAAGIVLVGNFAMQVVNWFDQRKIKKQNGEIKTLSVNRDAQIKEVKDLVNGKSEQLTALVAEKSFAAGRTFQIETPHEPSPPVAVVTPVSTTVAPLIVPVKVPD